LGAAVFQEPHFKIAGSPPQEMLWVLGEQGLRDYQALPVGEPAHSQAFAEAGTYVLRNGDLYLLFNASGSGVNGRGSHGHNDALSIEVSACGSAFIVDPGSYVYTADLKERHRFRSTSYHSTVEVDGAEQNITDEQAPFVIGNEAEPRVITWATGPETEVVSAEHTGYGRLTHPLTPRRTVRFEKPRRFWVVEDGLIGEGEHDFSFRFHFAPGLECSVRSDAMIEVCDKMNGARLIISASGIDAQPELEERFSSRDYGAKKPSVSVCWRVRAVMPTTARFVLIPLRTGEQLKITHELFAAPIANTNSSLES
jgi:uncharacterized heparinase superfamily protein